MKTYFIRHKLPAENSLCDAHRIAINFENLPVQGKDTNPTPNHFNDRKARAYRTALNYMIDLRDNGGYVFAEYGSGYIGKQNSKSIGCILARVDPQDQFEPFHTSNGQSPYHVTLKLEANSIGYIRYSDFPVLLAIRPPFSTICRPSRTYELIAKAFFNEEKIPASDNLDNLLNMFHPKMVEQLCVEYLRQDIHEEQALDYCTLRPGKSLAIIDIAGRLKNKRRLFAQIKNARLNARRTRELADQLAEFLEPTYEKDKGVGMLFTKFEPEQDYDGSIELISLEKVLRYFLERGNRTIIEDMIGIGHIETEEKKVLIEVAWPDQ